MILFAAVLIGVLAWTALVVTALALCRAASRADRGETEVESAGVAPADTPPRSEALPAPAAARR